MYTYPQNLHSHIPTDMCIPLNMAVGYMCISKSPPPPSLLALGDTDVIRQRGFRDISQRALSEF